MTFLITHHQWKTSLHFYALVQIHNVVVLNDILEQLVVSLYVVDWNEESDGVFL